MLSSQVEKEISSLNQRVRSLEQKVNQPRFAFKKSVMDGADFFANLNAESLARMMGWFMLTVTMLGLLETWIVNQSYDFYLAFLFLVSLWVVIRRSSLFSLSDSTIELDRQSRSKLALRHDAIHLQPGAAKRPTNSREYLLCVLRDMLFVGGGVLLSVSLTWSVYHYVSSSIWQTLLAVVVVIVSVLYYMTRSAISAVGTYITASYLLLVMSGSPLFAVLAMVIITAGMVYYSFFLKNWTFLLLVLVLSYGSLARWVSLLLSPAYLQSVIPIESYTLSIAIVSSLLAFLFLFGLPFVWRRRHADERELARGVIIANVVAFAAISLWLLSKGKLDGWLTTNFLVLLVSMGFGYVSWIYGGRYSYAKYFFSIGLIATALLFLVQPNHTVVNMMWFIFSVLLLSGGFLINSYSLRLFGLAALAMSVAYYFGSIMTNVLANPSAQGLADAAWVGALLFAFLLVAAGWYRTLSARGIEMAYNQVIVQACAASALFILFAWVQLTQIGFLQSFLWICLGLLALLYGSSLKYSFIQALGVSLIGIGAMKVMILDTQLVSATSRAGFLIVLSVFLIWCAYLIWKYPKRILNYIN
jgi:hypothetical protein